MQQSFLALQAALEENPDLRDLLEMLQGQQGSESDEDAGDGNARHRRLLDLAAVIGSQAPNGERPTQQVRAGRPHRSCSFVAHVPFCSLQTLCTLLFQACSSSGCGAAGQ